MPGSIPELLAAWRAAERRWERKAPSEEVRAAALEVIEAWAAYQDAALPADTREFILVADDVGTFVHATRGVTAALGYDAHDLIGLRIEDLAAIELQESTPGQWAAFPGRCPTGRSLPASDEGRPGPVASLPGSGAPSGARVPRLTSVADRRGPDR
jgi:PAS domain-containing protein